MKRRVLIYAHYYAPDVASTGQILQDIAEGMLDDFEVTVICVVPSYTGVIHEKYKKRKYFFEKLNGVNVVRVRVPEFSKENKLSRIKNILTYFYLGVLATRKIGEQDVVFSISQPPILGGILGLFGSWLKRAKYIYNIQDFNPEQIMSVGYSNNNIFLKLAMSLDKFTCRHADMVITVGRDLVETLKKRFANKDVPRYAMINNWIDEQNVYPLSRKNVNVLAFKKKYGLEGKFVVMYSGNIGLYYDLEGLMRVIYEFKPGTTMYDGREVIFAFVGAGTILNKLKEYVKENKMRNVCFIPYQDKSKLIYSLNAGDVHLCVNARGIKGVSCPSKAYGIMAVGKPIIGVLEAGTEIRSIIDESGCGKCCEPGDYEKIKKIIQWYIENDSAEMGERGRLILEKRLTKNRSVKEYINIIKGL
ncbi:Glycosyl transferases group 1 [Selenomonas ruminantium]|uniref:Glycosyl transferases group 1 n=1 Tax=Selenomonas ruminantium TaxID=971 RepID=A0A1I3EHN6_SELRU|nr:glycosyltransferase family 4 protein [Selenomonas ruminantium]SFH98408.1 Glycosyl transferases group 1 [Selenomonas ruminantium]